MENLQPEIGRSYQLGVDLAKYQDWTVITPFELNSFKVGNQERFNQIDWNLQKARIEATVRRFNMARAVVDSTGVGDPVAEDLERQGISVDPFKFTRISRRQILDNLAVLIEQSKILLPDDEGLFAELESMRFILVTTKDGKRRIDVQVPEGLTDDRIMSLALAVWDTRQPIGTTEKQQREFEDMSIYSKQEFN